MKPPIVVERFGIRLRPITMNDAEFIYKLRSHPELSKYMGEIDNQYSVHLAWLEEYCHLENDYYFCIERLTGEPIGTIAIYQVTPQSGKWGRWVIYPTEPAAPASVWLVFHIAFDLLGLSKLYSNTVIDNTKVVSFHDYMGLLRTEIEHNGLTIRGVSYDMVIHVATKEAWPSIQQALEKAAGLAERLFLEDENKESINDDSR